MISVSVCISRWSWSRRVPVADRRWISSYSPLCSASYSTKKIIRKIVIPWFFLLHFFKFHFINYSILIHLFALSHIRPRKLSSFFLWFLIFLKLHFIQYSILFTPLLFLILDKENFPRFFNSTILQLFFTVLFCILLPKEDHFWWKSNFVPSSHLWSKRDKMKALSGWLSQISWPDVGGKKLKTNGHII